MLLILFSGCSSYPYARERVSIEPAAFEVQAVRHAKLLFKFNGEAKQDPGIWSSAEIAADLMPLLDVAQTTAKNMKKDSQTSRYVSDQAGCKVTILVAGNDNSVDADFERRLIHIPPKVLRSAYKKAFELANYIDDNNITFADHMNKIYVEPNTSKLTLPNGFVTKYEGVRRNTALYYRNFLHFVLCHEAYHIWGSKTQDTFLEEGWADSFALLVMHQTDAILARKGAVERLATHFSNMGI